MKRLAGFLSAPVLAGLVLAGLASLPFTAPLHAQSAPFGFVRASTDLTRARPGACLQFTAALDARPETHYQDWVKLTPAPDAQYRVQDKLDATGIRHGRGVPLGRQPRAFG